jgi:hypothetical protein
VEWSHHPGHASGQHLRRQAPFNKAESCDEGETATPLMKIAATSAGTLPTGSSGSVVNRAQFARFAPIALFQTVTASHTSLAKPPRAIWTADAVKPRLARNIADRSLAKQID